MFDPSLYIVAGSFTACVGATIIVFWSDRREKRALEHLADYKGRWELMCGRAADQMDVIKAMRAVSAGLNDRIDRALAQGRAHPHSRPGKIIDILLGGGDRVVANGLFRQIAAADMQGTAHAARTGQAVSTGLIEAGS